MNMFEKIFKRKSKEIHNIADKYLKNDIINILGDGNTDENPRPKYKDGIPAYTLSLNQRCRIYDLSKGEFPFCTLRPIAWKSAIKEILWIYQDKSNDLNLLRDKYNVNYWDDWNIGNDTIGVRYGETVRRHNLIDNLIDGLKSDPFGRRHIMDLWQEDDLKASEGLKPCAFLTMWNVRKENINEYYLDMTLIQRSGDLLAASGSGGINEIQYACLLLMIAKVCGYKVGKFCHFVQNEQIYDRHFKAAMELLSRESISAPIIYLDTDKIDFYSFTIDDFKIKNYNRDEIAEKNPQLRLELGI